MNKTALIFYILFAISLILSIIYIETKLAKVLNIKKKKKRR